MSSYIYIYVSYNCTPTVIPTCQLCVYQVNHVYKIIASSRVHPGGGCVQRHHVAVRYISHRHQVRHRHALCLVESSIYNTGTNNSMVKYNTTTSKSLSTQSNTCISLYRLCVIPGLPSSIEQEELSSHLSSLTGAGIVAVKRSGTCSGYTWTAEFTSRGGDHPQMVG